MGKSVLFVLILTFAGFAQAFPWDPAQPPEARSFDLVLTKNSSQPLSEATIVAFRKIVGEFVANGFVYKYIELAAPAGGGFHVCIQPTEPAGYKGILEKLQTISAGSAGLWMPTLVESCPTSI